MPLNENVQLAVSQHPCFSADAHFKCGRIHLPVAPSCNIQCAYCDRKYDCPNESRPGVTSAVLTPAEALERVKIALEKEPRIRVAAVAGPGEPLFSPATLQTLELVRKNFPELSLCLSTNGLLLEENLSAIYRLGVSTITVTLNTLREVTAHRLYTRISQHGRDLPLNQGIPLLLGEQEAGIRKAAELGLAVKINTVLVPGLNETEIREIAETVSRWGAVLMNILPLIPQAKLQNVPRPSPAMIHEARTVGEQYLPQFTHCRQCRADACGIPGISDLSRRIF